MFLDELKNQTKTDSKKTQLLELRKKTIAELLEKFAIEEYGEIKELILEKARKGEYTEQNSKRVIECFFDIRFMFRLPQEAREINQLLIDNGEQQLFAPTSTTYLLKDPNLGFIPHAVVITTEGTETRTERVFVFKKQYQVPVKTTTFSFTDDTITFLRHIDALAKKDNIKLIKSIIVYAAAYDDETIPYKLEFENLYYSNEKMTKDSRSNYCHYIIRSLANGYVSASSGSLIRLKCYVEY